ncbi:MAG: amidohydrolase [Pseudomonadota bacterium]
MSKAEIVIENARILTMDPGTPRAESLALADGRILGLGRRAEIAGLCGPATRRIDAQGCTVLPGFVESHLHLFAGAFGLRLAQLDRVQGAEALRGVLLPYAAANPDEGLLICKAADYQLFGDGVATTRQRLDAVLADRPVICIAGDHHTAWANTLALSRAGLLNGRAMPTGSEVVMSADGTAAGELREHAAFDPVLALRTTGGRENLGLAGREPGPGLTAQERAEDEAVLLEGLRYCASFGFTNLHNMDGNAYQLALLASLETRGDLLCRIEIPFHLTPEKPLTALEDASAMQAQQRGAFLRSGRVKMFMDGVIDSATAVLLDPYSDLPGWHGAPLHDAERFAAACIDADRRGLQIAVHAIGDGAVRRTLDGFQAARAANGPRHSRHRIEHIELLHPQDLPRFRALGVVASMQPQHPPGAMDFGLEPWLSRIGPARWPNGFPVAALRKAGVPIAFASDWPVSDINPMRGIKAAMTRRPWSEDCPDNRATLHEALHAYTMGGAYAGHDEVRLGSLCAGKAADIVVIDRDLEALAPDALDSARAAITICGGRPVWEA